MSKDENVYLRHILDSISKRDSYIDGFTKEEFLDSSLVQDAVIRQLEIIGEATKRLPEAALKSKPDIPWQSIAGMRDKLIHDYFGVDIETAWLTALEDLPPLKEAASQILANQD